MLVVPDTNAVHQDPFFEKGHMKTIIDKEKDARIRLMIPEVVVDELRGHVEEQLNDLENDEIKLYQEFASISGQTHLCNVHITPERKQAVLDRFDRRVKQFREEGRILTYPSISPKELADRSIRDRRPFQSSGSGNQKSDRGMRDTLIWLTLKEHLMRMAAGPVSKILFVTNDERAFLDERGYELNESLVSELENEGILRDSVTIKRKLDDVIEFISPLRNIESECYSDSSTSSMASLN